MRQKFVRLHKKYLFLNSVVSLVFGAAMSYLFSSIVEVWKTNSSIKQKIISCAWFIIVVIVATIYYKYFSSDSSSLTSLEKEREKSEIERIKNETEMTTILYKEGSKEIQNDNLTIKQKTEIFLNKLTL